MYIDGSVHYYLISTLGVTVYVRVELHVTYTTKLWEVSFYKIQALWSINSGQYEKFKHCFYMYLAMCGYIWLIDFLAFCPQ